MTERSSFSKIRNVLTSPLPDNINRLKLAFYRIKGILYYRRVFASFGSGSVLYKPVLTANISSMRIGARTTIGRSAHIELIREYAGIRYSPTMHIGSDVYIGPHLYAVCIGNISIGDGSVLSEHVYLHDSSHGFDPESGLIMQQGLVHVGNINIGRNCFLGFRSAIMPGVTLGDHCIVGVNAVVTKSFPPYSMIAGVPAILIRQYSHEQKKWIRVP